MVPLEGVHPVLTGGETKPNTGRPVCPIAHQGARTLLYDVFFTLAGGISAEVGTSEVSVPEAEIKRAFAANSRSTVLCVDSTMLGGRFPARAIDLADISAWVTRLDSGDERLDRYRALVEIP